MSGIVDAAVELASMGLDHDKVLEATLSYGPGRRLRVKSGTTATKDGGGSVGVPEGTVVTVIGVGGGRSGVDPVVQLPDGTVATVPFDKVMEGIESSDFDSNDDTGDDKANEGVVGSVARVTLAKPLPEAARAWLSKGYFEYGISLPPAPESDSASSVTFLMKAEDDDVLESTIELLKKMAGASFKSSKAATLVDWDKAFKQ